MRKLNFIIGFISLISHGQKISITGVFDGPLTGGTPKVVELYCHTTIEDLSTFALGTANNGTGSAGAEYPLSGSATQGHYLYITKEATGFINYFGFEPDFVSNTANINGNDALELFELEPEGNWTLKDRFGNPDTDGKGTLWDYEDGWSYRIETAQTITPVFIPEQWYFSGTNVNDDSASNNTAEIPFPLGTFNQNLAINTENTTSKTLLAYPNPVGKNQKLFFSKTISNNSYGYLLDVFGRVVKKINPNTASISLRNMQPGTYILHIENGENTYTERILKM